MRGLVIGLGVVSVLWTGLWLGASALAKRGVNDWVASRQQVGQMAGHDGLSVQGWPGRLTLTLDAPYYADPWTGLSWVGPRAQVTLDALKPTALRAEMPGVQTLHTPAGTLTLSTDALEAEVALAGTDLALDSVGLRARLFDLAGPDGAGLRFDSFELDLHRGDAPARYMLDWRMTAIRPDPARTTLPGAEGAEMPGTIDRVGLRAALDLTAPLDRHAGVRAEPPALQALRFDDIALDWGRAEITGTGALAPDARGFAEGEIVLNVRNWPDLIAVAVALDWLDAELAPTWTRFLTLLQDETPEAAAEGVLVARLRFGGGRARLGPIPLGPAPLMVPAGF